MASLSTHFMVAVPPLLVAAAAPLHTPFCGLFMANLLPTYQTLEAALTGAGALPTYTGYVQVAPTFASVYQDTNGTVVLQTNLIEFPGPNDNTGVTIYGWFISDAASPGNLLLTDRFPAPIPPITLPGAIVFTAQININPSGGIVVQTTLLSS